MRTLKLLGAAGLLMLPATAAVACPDHENRYFAFSGMIGGGPSSDSYGSDQSQDGSSSSTSSDSSSTSADNEPSSGSSDGQSQSSPAPNPNDGSVFR